MHAVRLFIMALVLLFVFTCCIQSCWALMYVPSPYMRQNTLEALIAIGAPSVPALCKKLSDKDPDIAIDAACALAAIQDPTAVEALVTGALDADDVMRAVCAIGLAARGDRRAITPLLSALHDRRPPGYGSEIARALGAFPNDPKDRIVPELIAIVQQFSSPDAKPDAFFGEYGLPSAALALGQIGDRRAVPALIAAFEMLPAKSNHRDRLAYALAAIGDNRAIPLLLDGLEQGTVSHEVLENSITRLCPEVVPGLIRLLKSEKHEVHMSVISLLARCRDARAIDPLLAVAKCDTDEYHPWERTEAINALGQIGMPDSAPLLALLRHGSVKAAPVLVSMAERHPEIMPAFAEMMRTDSTIEVRRAIVVALKGCRLPGVYGLLCAATQSRDLEEWSIRQNAVKALGIFGNHAALEMLVPIMNERDSSVALEAKIAVGRLKDARALPLLLAELRRKHLGDIPCDDIARALACIGSPAYDSLVAALAEEDYPKLRYTAVRALGLLGDKRAVSSLIAVLRDERDASMILPVIVSLGELGDPTAVEALREFGWYYGYEDSTLIALGKLKDPRSVPAIASLLNEELYRFYPTPVWYYNFTKPRSDIGARN